MSGIHVAIIMDGNGRWARERGKPRTWGHRAGAETVRKVVEAAPDLGVGTLTLYAFSSDNWKRPGREVSALMNLFRRHLRAEVRRMQENGIRLEVIGRRDRLPGDLVELMEAVEAATAPGDRLILRLAVDYSARDALVRGAAALAGRGGPPPDREALEAAMLKAIHGRPGTPPVDLLIRTGGEQRLSDFLLWEAAYAELVFTPRMWPDFSPLDLAAAIREFQGRERRFGAVEAPAPSVLAS